MRPTIRLAAPLALLAAALALAGGCSKSTPVTCPAGQSSCGGICFDLQNDALSCGTCLRACPAGAVCLAGACQCPAGTRSCGGACVDVTTSSAHCGGCDQPCGTGTCQGGTCDCGATTACPGPAPGEPRCIDTRVDPANCGACGNACGAGLTCQAGACVCLAPRTDCGAAGCLALATDERNCGTSCQNAVACPPTSSCLSGACSCIEGQSVCGGACVDLARDPANCGECGKTCAAGGVCEGGFCGCPDSARLRCGPLPGTCVDPDSDEANCGGCGDVTPAAVCGAGDVCQLGLCCGPAQQACGLGLDRQCCDGTGCCPGGACQATHSNGLGQSHFSCDPVGTYTRDAALLAARAWLPTGGTVVEQVLLCLGCLCLQDTTRAATWCYAEPLQGQVSLNTISDVCLCPPQGNQTGTWD